MLSVSAREKENRSKREKATIALCTVENATEGQGRNLPRRPNTRRVVNLIVRAAR